MVRTLFIPAEGFKGQETSRTAYNIDLARLEAWLEKLGMTIFEMTDRDWPRFIHNDDWDWAYKTERRALSAVWYWLKKVRGIFDHSLFKVPWPDGSRKPPRRITPRKRDILLAACEKMRPVMRARNKAIIRVFGDTGIRKFELAGAKLSDLDLIERELIVLTKARPNKPRDWELKVFSRATSETLTDWLKVRDDLAKPGCDTLFVSQTGIALTREGVSDIFKRLSKRVGFQVSPHDFRRGLGSHATEKQIPDNLTMRQMGIGTHKVFRGYAEGAEIRMFANQLWGDDA